MTEADGGNLSGFWDSLFFQQVCPAKDLKNKKKEKSETRYTLKFNTQPVILIYLDFSSVSMFQFQYISIVTVGMLAGCC